MAMLVLQPSSQRVVFGARTLKRMGTTGMRRLATIAALLASSLALAQSSVSVPIAVDLTGVNGENLQDTPVTDAINMHLNPSGGGAPVPTNQLALTLAVTPGTTTSITVFCSEADSTGVTAPAVNTFAKISRCPSGACTPDVRTFTLSDFTTVSGVKYITARFHVTKKWAACTLDDAANGTGTVVVTGTRSWQ